MVCSYFIRVRKEVLWHKPIKHFNVFNAQYSYEAGYFFGKISKKLEKTLARTEKMCKIVGDMRGSLVI